MLTKEDLQAIGGLISASEERTAAKIDTAIAASEERMTGKIEASEERMTAKIGESEERTKREIKAYIENTVEKSVQIILEGHSDLRRDMKDLLQQEKKISDLQDRMFAVELKLKQG